MQLIMSQTNDYIEDLLSTYKERESDQTYLKGNVQMQDWIIELPFCKSEKIIMSILSTIEPEIAQNWQLDVISDITGKGIKSFYCLKRYDHPFQMNSILKNYSIDELKELGYESDDFSDYIDESTD